MTLVLSGIIENDKRNPKGIAMPDIALRLNKDMLVLSAPLDARLQDQGFDIEKDAAYLALFEPDSVRDALRMELLAGATCLVANTASITPARLTHLSMEDRADEFVEASLAVAHELNPQHVLVEIAPCGLPLDASSKASLNENRSQYARAVRTFANRELDAFFLNGFTTCDDLKCALMGVRQASDMPVFASVDVLPSGTLSSGRGTLAKAVSVMEEYGATVAGFNTGAQAQDAVRLANEAAAACDLPLLVQLHVAERNPRQGSAYGREPLLLPRRYGRCCRATTRRRRAVFACDGGSHPCIHRRPCGSRDRLRRDAFRSGKTGEGRSSWLLGRPRGRRPRENCCGDGKGELMRRSFSGLRIGNGKPA